MILKINGNNIDIEGQVVAITRQSYDFFDLSFNLIDRSNEFSLPLTQNNKYILNNPDAINCDKLQFETKYKAQLVDSGVTLLSGTGYVTESDNGYSFQLTDGCRELFDSFEVSMRSLDLDSQDFVWTSAYASFDSMRELNNSVWLWAITLQRIDDSSWENTPLDGVYQYVRPGFAVSKLLDKIEAYSGWTFEQSGDDSSWGLFNSLFITSNHKDFITSSYEKVVDETAVGNTNVVLSTYTFKESSVTTSTYYFDVHTQKCKVRFRGAVTADDGFYVVIKSTVPADPDKNKIERFYFASNTTEINILTNEFDQAAANNRISLSIETEGNVTFDDCRFYTVISEEDLSFDLTGFKVKTYENIDNDSISSFLKNIFNITGCFFSGDYDRKKLKLYNYSQFNKLNTEDWSSKFIKEGYKITTGEGLARKNYFVYTNDDTLEEDTGSAFFECENENLKGEENVLEIAFSASKDTTLETGDWYEYVGSQLFEQNTAYLPIYNSNTERFELDKRILSFYTKTLLKGYPTPTDSANFTFARFVPLDFSSLINTTYKDISSALNKPRIIEAYFNLSKKDVVLFDFTKQVYIDFFKSNFFIIEISNFITNSKTLVKIIRNGRAN